jgi:HEAT repeat protein
MASTVRRATVPATLAFLAAAGGVEPAALAVPSLDGRIEKYARLLASDASFKIRAVAAQKLTTLADEDGLGDPRIVAALTHGLTDDSAIVRGVCVKGLAKHHALGAIGRLTYLAKFDPDDSVQMAAEDSIEAIKRMASVRAKPPEHRPRKSGPITVEIGRVDVEPSPGLTTQVADSLRSTVRDAVEDQIEPHKPAIFPREDPDLRMDVTVARSRHGNDIQVEVRVTLVQLPDANLRHASRALARTKTKSAPTSLDRKLALEAVTRAVSDALAMVYTGR